MSRFVQICLRGASLSAMCASVVALSASSASATPQRHRARLIDTTRVIGTPQAGIGSIRVDRPSGNNQRTRGTAPVITAQPSSTTVNAGTTASFSAAASGSPTPTVAWLVSSNRGRSWSKIRGATSSSYAFTATLSENGEEFEATFSNTAGSATSKPAVLTVSSGPPVAPVVTEQPASLSLDAGTTASFSASASGTPAPSVQWQVSTDDGDTWSAIRGATATPYRFTAALSQNGEEFEAVFSNTAGSATTSPAILTVIPVPEQSSNWSGYADTGTTFTAVSASWTVPTVTCPTRTTAYSAQWVGIDGDTSSTVEQDGTEADCLSGKPSYDAWFEMYGDSAVNQGDEVEISPTTDPVDPGDVVSAGVTVSGNAWVLTLTDTSSAHVPWTYTTTPIKFAGAARWSAEWIVERPEICGRSCSLASLADFGSVTFTSASTTSSTGTGTGTGTITSATDSEIEMVSGSSVIAMPSALDTAGDSFSDEWRAS